MVSFRCCAAAAFPGPAGWRRRGRSRSYARRLQARLAVRIIQTIAGVDRRLQSDRASPGGSCRTRSTAATSGTTRRGGNPRDAPVRCSRVRAYHPADDREDRGASCRPSRSCARRPAEARAAGLAASRSGLSPEGHFMSSLTAAAPSHRSATFRPRGIVGPVRPYPFRPLGALVL